MGKIQTRRLSRVPVAPSAIHFLRRQNPKNRLHCPILEILSDYKIPLKSESYGFFKLTKVTLNRSQTAKNVYRGNFLKIRFFAFIFDRLARFSKFQLHLIIWKV